MIGAMRWTYHLVLVPIYNYTGMFGFVNFYVIDNTYKITHENFEVADKSNHNGV